MVINRDILPRVIALDKDGTGRRGMSSVDRPWDLTDGNVRI